MFANLHNTIACSCFRVNDAPIVHFYGAHCVGTESSLMACGFIELSNRTCGPRGFVSIHCCELQLMCFVTQVIDKHY